MQQQQPVQPYQTRALALAAVRQDGRALEHAAEHLRADCEIVLEAVRQNGKALVYAAEQLKGDREIVLEAVRYRSWMLEYAAEHLRDDGFFLYKLTELSKEHPEEVRKYASPRIQGEMVKDPGYLERYAPVQVKPARSARSAPLCPARYTRLP
jgi:hypothetical protein